MIKITNLHKRFGKNQVLKAIDLDLNSDGITAILGPNGSGKTTLIKSILGMVIPDKGNILLNEKSIKNENSYRNQLAYLPQIAHFPENLNSLEIIRMIKDLRPEEAKDDYFIEMFGLRKEMKKRMSSLSGGTRQKVNLVLCLMYDTPLLILDEPSNGLDPLALQHLKQHLISEKLKGRKIIITTHIMSFVEDLADNIVFLLEGDIYFNGKLNDLLTSHQETKLENAIAKILQSHPA